MNKNRMLDFFQKLGKVLMTPVLILPIAGILVSIATSLTTANVVNTLPFLSNSIIVSIMNMMKAVGNLVINNLPVLFAICTAFGYAKAEKGAAALNGFLGFMVLNVTMGSFLTSIGQMDPTKLSLGQSSILGVATLNTGVFGGILVGAMVSYLHNRYYKIELPVALSFFNGTRFIPAVSILGSIILGVILCVIFPPIQSVLNSLASFIKDTGAFGSFIYGFSERMLLPFGMHLLVLIPLMMTPMGGTKVIEGVLYEGPVNIYNAILNTPGAMFDADVSRFVMNGKILMAFGFAAIALAMYKTSFLKNRKKTKALMIAAALPCVLTGISEPLEFAFLFISPVLYIFHAVMCGLAYMLLYIVNFNVAGLSAFGGPVLSIIFNGILQADKGSNWYWVFILGIPYFLIYYYVFKAVILKMQLQTPGREADIEAENNNASVSKSEIVTGIINALGGITNIASVDSCFTRLRVVLNDLTIISKDSVFTSQLEAKGVVHVGNGLQIIYGQKAELYKTEINEILERAASEAVSK